jgi:hypothetical protein
MGSMVGAQWFHTAVILRFHCGQGKPCPYGGAAAMPFRRFRPSGSVAFVPFRAIRGSALFCDFSIVQGCGEIDLWQLWKGESLLQPMIA